MTICIAAISRTSENQYQIIGAADRKVTAGDIQFEPPVQKVYTFTSHIVALIAGDSAAQKEICDYTWQAQGQTVRDVVRIYCQQLGEYNRRQAEQVVLAPLGLTMKTFLQNQHRMLPDFAQRIMLDIRRERAEIETIICGMDDFGAQIFTIDGTGRSSCQNSIGFAAIGDGANHAESQFMFARYTSGWFLSRSMMLTYIAKKRAEVAPGVGLDTDFFFIADRGFTNFVDPILNGLEECYKVLGDAQERAVRESNIHLDTFLQKLVEKEFGKAEDSSPPTSQPPMPEPPPDNPPQDPPTAS